MTSPGYHAGDVPPTHVAGCQGNCHSLHGSLRSFASDVFGSSRHKIATWRYFALCVADVALSRGLRTVSVAGLRDAPGCFNLSQRATEGDMQPGGANAERAGSPDPNCQSGNGSLLRLAVAACVGVTECNAHSNALGPARLGPAPPSLTTGKV